jgi:hypothetical protein
MAEAKLKPATMALRDWVSSCTAPRERAFILIVA